MRGLSSVQSSFFNYLGQLRVYSLIDLVFLLVALQISLSLSVGILLLHLGFILYLENKHHHTYRLPFPSFLWIILTLAGIFFYMKIEVLGFLLASYLYTKKNNSSLAPYASFFRGLQFFFSDGRGRSGTAGAAAVGAGRLCPGGDK